MAPKTYIVEHLDPELEQWSALEYSTIAKECKAAGANFLLSSVAPSLKAPANVNTEQRSVEELYEKQSVCLLDPAATIELSPADGDKFDVFLFGGILGTAIASVFTSLNTFFVM